MDTLKEVQEFLKQDWGIRSQMVYGAEHPFGTGLYCGDEWGELTVVVIRTDIFIIKYLDGREDKWTESAEEAASMACEAYYELDELA